MGNCCEAVNTTLDEILEINELNSTYSTNCHSLSHSINIDEPASNDTSCEEVPLKLHNKARGLTFKLDTVVEDNCKICARLLFYTEVVHIIKCRLYQYIFKSKASQVINLIELRLDT